MTSHFETVANSSEGEGLIVSLDRGRRTEKFMNTQKYWYYGTELVLVDLYQSFEMKLPGLGDLTIFRAEWGSKKEGYLVARFPKGSWEYVRVVDTEDTIKLEMKAEHPSAREEMNSCPEGCNVRGWANLGAKTKSNHMDLWHSGRNLNSPFQ